MYGYKTNIFNNLHETRGCGERRGVADFRKEEVRGQALRNGAGGSETRTPSRRSAYSGSRPHRCATGRSPLAADGRLCGNERTRAVPDGCPTVRRIAPASVASVRREDARSLACRNQGSSRSHPQIATSSSSWTVLSIDELDDSLPRRSGWIDQALCHH